jgi:serine protease Do
LLLLKVEGSGFPYLEMGDSSALEVGDLAVVIGNPLGMLHSSLTAGVISATERELSIENTKMTLLQTDAAINVGNSGGALLNCYGEVVGVVIAKSSGLGVEGLAYAIPIDTAKPIISELRSHGYVSGRPMLGIIMNNLAVGGNVQGVYVQSIVEDGAAEQAGLQAGDIISQIFRRGYRHHTLYSKFTAILYRIDLWRNAARRTKLRQYRAQRVYTL